MPYWSGSLAQRASNFSTSSTDHHLNSHRSNWLSVGAPKSQRCCLNALRLLMPLIRAARRRPAVKGSSNTTCSGARRRAALRRRMRRTSSCASLQSGLRAPLTAPSSLSMPAVCFDSWRAGATSLLAAMISRSHAGSSSPDSASSICTSSDKSTNGEPNGDA
eukprot:CAMPEP_0180440680 /NCGR_PEP_ID=MMETSP1036_2-20121128/13236_1 /TAXON_ID=632150 /ORGANISM="Azadinium spinosum, Strain 3D9" /LENGTH=161 /DNA_ID=CAMNT_0022446873 /DNA_START=27 /DNA_END=512 /DNA_ORIENTATION=-